MDKLKIAILELETHTQVIKQWDYLLRDSDVIDVDYYLHSKLKVNLAFLNPQKTFYTHSSSNLELEDFISGIPQYDLIIINTLHRHFQSYSVLFEKQKTLCIVHNPNFSLFNKPVTIGNLINEKAQFFYFLKLFVKERIQKYKDIIFQSDYFGVFSNAIYNEIVRSGIVSQSRLNNISLVYNECLTFRDALPVKIVIPGTVSEKRKDYLTVFETIEKLNPKSPIVFYFLGRPENKKMERKLDELSKLKRKNVEVVYFTKLIPSKEFDVIIQSCHILLCPIKVKTSFYGVTEFYGKTKISGNEYDCIRNGKIGMFPTSYPRMDWHNWYYQNENELLQSLNNITVEMLKSEYEKLKPYAEKYTFEKVKNELEAKLIKLTQN